MSEEPEYHCFNMRIISSAGVNQKIILEKLYDVLRQYGIESGEAAQREKGKYCVYKVPVKIEKKIPLTQLYSDLGKIAGIKTVI
ncbi:MAG: DUF493 family protein [Spirochaetales bacterium]|nr:DUF493 family protein [Spirochaetales bacterium]